MGMKRTEKPLPRMGRDKLNQEEERLNAEHFKERHETQLIDYHTQDIIAIFVISHNCISVGAQRREYLQGDGWMGEHGAE